MIDLEAGFLLYKVKWAQHEQQSAKIYKRFDKGTKHGKWKANETVPNRKIIVITIIIIIIYGNN